MKDLKQLGSQTAINGFRNEDEIVTKFNNWQKNTEAKLWLKIMQYDLNEIEYVRAEKIAGHYKADIQVQVTIKLKKLIDLQNMQIKLVSQKRGFNQTDKRKVDTYAEMWNMPDRIALILKRYTGEILPNISNSSDRRRMYMNEFPEVMQKVLIEWLESNRLMIVSDILRGRGKFTAEWLLVAQKLANNARWILKPMSFCINLFGSGEICITPRGSVRIGHITMQRKGGDGGRESSKLLQFKINPTELFEI